MVGVQDWLGNYSRGHNSEKFIAGLQLFLAITNVSMFILIYDTVDVQDL